MSRYIQKGAEGYSRIPDNIFPSICVTIRTVVKKRLSANELGCIRGSPIQHVLRLSTIQIFVCVRGFQEGMFRAEGHKPFGDDIARKLCEKLNLIFIETPNHRLEEYIDLAKEALSSRR